MSPEFRMLLSQYVGVGFAKQLAFADLLGERGWGVDLGEGQVTFGDDLKFPIQLLGSESDGDESWLWAWANEASNLPSALLKSCRDLKELGSKLDVSELIERSCSTSIVDGHSIAMIASGLDSTSCYCRGPYDGGALYFLVRDLPKEVISPVSSERAITTISQVTSTFDVDHRQMTKSFLSSQGFKVTEAESQISSYCESGNIRIEFDSEGRLSNIDGTLTPPNKKPRKKNGWKFWVKK